MSKEISSSDKVGIKNESKKFKNKAEALLKDKKAAEETLNEAIKKASENKGPISKVFENLKLLFSITGDYISGKYREIPYGSILAIIGALLYFLSPVDFWLDTLPGGYVDDVFVIGLVLEQFAGDLEKYKIWKNK